MASTYKSAMGRPVDMARMRSNNSGIRAVGNMNVNGAGDTIDSENKVTTNAGQRVNRVYNKATVNPTAAARQTPVKAAPAVASAPVKAAAPAPDINDDVLSEAELDLERELEEEIVPEKPEMKFKKK